MSSASKPTTSNTWKPWRVEEEVMEAEEVSQQQNEETLGSLLFNMVFL